MSIVFSIGRNLQKKMLCSKNKKVAASIPQFLVKSKFFNKIFFIWNTKLSDLTPYSRILYFLRKQSIISKIITQFDQNEKKNYFLFGKKRRDTANK